MNIVKTTYWLILVCMLPVILLSACIEVAPTSPLSNEPISNPSLIKFKAVIGKSVEASGQTRSNVYVTLEDKDGLGIALSQGSVTVNNLLMQKHDGFDFDDPVFPFSLISVQKQPYYRIGASQLEIRADSSYVFTLTLADGKKYSASIRTQEMDLHTLVAPSTHNKTLPMTLKWKEAEGRYPITINTIRTAQQDTVQKSYFASFTASNPGTGEYTFASSFFTEHVGTVQASFTVYSTKYGQVDASFLSGSHVRSVFDASATVAIE